MKLITRPYQARQEELVRAINHAIAKRKSLLLARLRQKLIDEQEGLSGPTLAFIAGCRLLNRPDLLLDSQSDTLKE